MFLLLSWCSVRVNIGILDYIKMVKIAVFGTKQWVKQYFTEYNTKNNKYEVVYFDATLSPQTVCTIALFNVCFNDIIKGAISERV